MRQSLCALVDILSLSAQKVDGHHSTVAQVQCWAGPSQLGECLSFAECICHDLHFVLTCSIHQGSLIILQSCPDMQRVFQAVAVAARDGSLDPEQQPQPQRPRAPSHSLGSMPKFSADLHTALNGLDSNSIPETPSPDSSRTASSRETTFHRDAPSQQPDSISKAEAEGSQQSASSQAASDHAAAPAAGQSEQVEAYVNPFEQLMKQQPPPARTAQRPSSTNVNFFEQLVQQQQQSPGEPKKSSEPPPEPNAVVQLSPSQLDSVRGPAPPTSQPSGPKFTRQPESFRLQRGDASANSEDSPPATPSMAQAGTAAPLWSSSVAQFASFADAAQPPDEPLNPSSSAAPHPANSADAPVERQSHSGSWVRAPSSRDNTPDRLPRKGQAADAEQRFPTPTRQPGFPKSLARPGHVPAHSSESAAPNFPMPRMPPMPTMPVMPQPAAASASPRAGESPLQLRWSSSSLGRQNDESSPRSPSLHGERLYLAAQGSSSGIHLAKILHSYASFKYHNVMVHGRSISCRINC